MHVGVLIPVMETDKEKGKQIAQNILYQDRWCWNEEEGEDGNWQAQWDWPYDIHDSWYDGHNEETRIPYGITVAELKEQYLKTERITKDVFAGMFDFYYNVDEDDMIYWPDKILEYIEELPDNMLLYVGSVHV